MADKKGFEIYESRHEFVPPPEKRHKKRTKFKKGQAAAVTAALLAGILMLAPVSRTQPPDETAPPVQTTAATEATEAPTEATEPVVEAEPPTAELYPIYIASEITGVIILPEPERVTGLTVTVWEKTQERKLDELDVPEEKYKTGRVPLPLWSFWDDYEAHADEYAGSMLDEGTDYIQELRAELRYDDGNGETKTVEYAAEAVETDTFYWLWSAEEYDEFFGTSVARPDCVSIILEVESLDPEPGAKTVLVDEPDKVTDGSTYSVRAEIDGEPVTGVTVSYDGTMPIIHIPLPAGMERGAQHIYRLYVTQYVDGYGKAVEFISEDDF